MLKSSSSQKFEFPVFIWRSVVDIFLVQTYLFPIWWSCVSLTKKSTSNKKAFFVDDKSHQEFKQKSLFSLKISFTKKKVNKQKKPFLLMISLNKKKVNFKQKSLFLLRISFTKKSQQIKMPFFVKENSHQEKKAFFRQR